MGYRKMAKDPEGNVYVAERDVDGDAVLKVIDFTVDRRGEPPVVFWPTANYEVSVPNADPPVPAVRLIRRGGGLYDVPDVARGLPMLDAVRIALGRQQAPAPIEHRRQVRAVRSGRSAGRDGHNLSTAPNAATVLAPAVINEPESNRAFKQGDRIMRHLALYPEGVDAQTLSAGLHNLSTSQVRAHLRRMCKNSGPVREVRTGIYTRREAS